MANRVDATRSRVDALRRTGMFCRALSPRHDLADVTRADAPPSLIGRLGGSVLRSQQFGLVLVLLLLGTALTFGAGSHVDPQSHQEVNNFLNRYTLIQMATDASAFAIMGVGTSAIFPLAMSAAAQRTDRPAATNVAALAQISFVAFLLGPPLLGFAAQHWGIRWSFGLGLPLVALSLWAAGSLCQRPATGR